MYKKEDILNVHRTRNFMVYTRYLVGVTAIQICVTISWSRETRNANRILVEIPFIERSLEISIRRWECNVKMDFGEIGREDCKLMTLITYRGNWCVV
jgi:hypothetical protein